MEREPKSKHLLFTGIFSVIAAFFIISAVPVYAQAAQTYLNTTTKYLYLGLNGKDTYDFDLAEEELDEVTKSSWYVVSSKGNENCVTIDSKSGVVTAKHVGTAYIACKITLNDGTIIRPQAKIVVRNNITKVSIANIPADKKIQAGKVMDFEPKVENTVAGKEEKASDITRWELKNDCAEVGEISEEGLVLPTTAGTFQLRAVCFKDSADYHMWLKNKKRYANKVTAVSKWATIWVTESSGKGYASTQEGLEKLLKTKNITEINLIVDDINEITVPDGDYYNKNIILTSEVNNSDQLEKEISLYFSSNSNVGTLITRRAGLTLHLHLYGDDNLDKVVLDNTTNIDISGRSQRSKLTLEPGVSSAGSSSSTSIPLKVEPKANATLRFLQGAEGSTITTSSSTLALTIDNRSLQAIQVDLSGYTRMVITNKEIRFASLSEFISNTGTSSGTLDQSGKELPLVLAPVTATDISAGQTLSNSALSGSFTTSKGDSIPGSLSWKTPYERVSTAGYYDWTFVPNDQSRYSVVTGKLYVKINDLSTFELNQARNAIESANTSGQFTDFTISENSNISAKIFSVMVRVTLIAQNIDPDITALAEYQYSNNGFETYRITLKIGGNSVTFNINKVVFRVTN